MDEGSLKLSFSDVGPCCHWPEHTMGVEEDLLLGKTLFLMLCLRLGR